MNYEEITQKVLKDYTLKLSSSLEMGEDFRVYYKNGGDTISVLTVVDRDDDQQLLSEIYKTEAKILRTYVLSNKDKEGELNINFRVVPQYSSLVSAIVPKNFRRYAKIQL